MPAKDLKAGQRLPAQQRQKISSIIDKGKALQKKMAKTQEEISSHLSQEQRESISNDKSDDQPQFKTVQFTPQIQLNKTEKVDYDLIAEKSKYQLDQLEE